jgi:uncharacterized protein
MSEVWLNEPPSWERTGVRVSVRTGPDTDFWRRTHYGFVRDNGHFLALGRGEDVVARVDIDGDYVDHYDQAGLMLRIDEERWLKCGVEYVDGSRLASAVVTDRYSDWSVAPLPKEGVVGFELRREGGTILVSYRTGERSWTLLRVAPFPAGAADVGVMCASPDGGGFDVRFIGIEIALAADP